MLASMPPPPNLTGHSTENKQQGQYQYGSVLVSTPAPVQMAPQMVQQTAPQTVPQTAVPMPMNFPVPGTGPAGWQQVATSGSEWRDLRRRWGNRQDMNNMDGVDQGNTAYPSNGMVPQNMPNNNANMYS